MDKILIHEEAQLILNKLLIMYHDHLVICKYMHELVYQMVLHKKYYLDILYEVITLIPEDLYITTGEIFKFETTNEFIAKHCNPYQQTIFDLLK